MLNTFLKGVFSLKGNIDSLFIFDFNSEKFDELSLCNFKIKKNIDENDGFDENKKNFTEEYYNDEYLIDTINKEYLLLGIKNEIFTNQYFLMNDISILKPIKIRTKEIEELIYPVLYRFKDGRNILKLSYNFSSYDKDTYFINKDYVDGEIKIKGSNLLPNDMNKSYFELSQYYFKELSQFMGVNESDPNQELIQTYTNITILNNNKTNIKELNKELYLLSKAPVFNKKESDKDPSYYLNGLSIYSNEIRSVSSISGEFYDKLNNQDIEFPLTNIQGQYQGVLEMILLKKFSTTKNALQFYNGDKTQEELKKARDENLKYTTTDNTIAFSEYQSNLNMYSILYDQVFSSQKQKLIAEIETKSTRNAEFEIESSVNHTNNMIGYFGILIAVLTSYKVIQEVIKAIFNLSDRPSTIWAIVISIALGRALYIYLIK